MSEDISIRDRLTRAEERLIAEQSARKTRDDQLFKFISQVHEDLENQGASMRDLNETLQKLNATLTRMEDRVESQNKALEKLESGTQDNRDNIQEINGSVRTIKWIWPLIMTLSGVIMTLFIANIDLRLEQEIKDRDTVESKPEEITQEESNGRAEDE